MSASQWETEMRLRQAKWPDHTAHLTDHARGPGFFFFLTHQETIGEWEKRHA